MQSMPRTGVGGASRGAFVEGLGYVRGHALLHSLLLVDLKAVVFGMSSALFAGLGMGLFLLPAGLLLATVVARERSDSAI